MQLMLEISSLYFDYQDNPLLQNVNFSIQSGQFLHLQGANGVGKTTLLKLISGLFLPHQGSIRWQGKNIHDNLGHFQNLLCFVGHQSGCHGALTVYENCRFDVNFRGNETDLSAALHAFGLWAYRFQICSTLSAGQLRRLSLARLLMRPAHLWILDESFASLDKIGVEALSLQLKNHVKSGGMVVATAHHSLPELSVPVVKYCL